jgi:hypothetical protein
MKKSIALILVSVTACAICSLVTYRIAYHSGQVSMIQFNSKATCFILGDALHKIRVGDTPQATRVLETFYFGSAAVLYGRPTDKDGETKTLAKELSQYRNAYRTNSADWDIMERKLEVELACIK